MGFFFKRKSCFCTARAPYMPMGATCWTLTPDMNDWLNPDDNDFEVSNRERLSVTTECPDSLSDCNDLQSHVVIYYKINRFWYGVGKKCKRNKFSICVVNKVRSTYDQDPSDSESE